MSNSDPLRQLTDRIEIQELSARYNRSADDGDGEALAAVFTEDGAMVAISGDDERTVRGSHELFAMVDGRPPGTTVHMTMDAIIEIDGDEGRQWCSLLLLRRLHEEARVALRTGRYEDRLLRTAAGWRFVERRVTIDGANQSFMVLAEG